MLDAAQIETAGVSPCYGGAVLWKITIGDKLGVRATTDADGNLYVFLDKFGKRIATVIAITPPAA